MFSGGPSVCSLFRYQTCENDILKRIDRFRCKSAQVVNAASARKVQFKDQEVKIKVIHGLR